MEIWSGPPTETAISYRGTGLCSPESTCNSGKSPVPNWRLATLFKYHSCACSQLTKYLKSPNEFNRIYSVISVYECSYRSVIVVMQEGIHHNLRLQFYTSEFHSSSLLERKSLSYSHSLGLHAQTHCCKPFKGTFHMHVLAE